MGIGRQLKGFFEAFSKQNRRRIRRAWRTIDQAVFIEHLEQRVVLTTVTAYEQYFLELINRARQDPVAEASRLGIDLNEGLTPGTLPPGARQPLALNDSLQASIEGHLADELAHNYFAHAGFDGSTPQTRIEAAGYTGWTTIGENLGVEYTSGSVNVTQFVTDEYVNLFVDTTEPDRGHRINIVNGAFKEVGSAVQTGLYLGFNAVDTGNDFGARPGNSFLTGVVYTDAVTANNFYNVGEGIGSASIVVKSGATVVGSTTANAAGGYQIALPSGTYTVTFSGAGISSPTSKSFTISSLNVKVDANTRVDIGAIGPPALSATSPQIYTENTAASLIDAVITVADPGRTTMSTANITIGNFVAGQDVIGFVPNAGTMGNIVVSSNSGGVLQLASAGSTATLVQWQTALRAITYLNSSDNPTTTTRNVTFVVDDGNASNHLSNTLSTTVQITAVNDPPVLAAIEGTTVTYNALAPATAITSALTVSDVDNTNLASATVKISAGYQSGFDQLTFTNTATITGSFNAGTGTLTLTGSDTLTNYQAALRAVKFQNTSGTPTIGTRTMTFQVNDGSAANNLSNQPTRTVTVSNGTPPAIANIPGTLLAYTEKDPATIIASAITITDSDSTNLGSARIQITGGYTTGQDRLSFTNSAGVTSLFDATTGTLTLTGVKSVAAYQTLLQSVSYQNMSYAPSVVTRTISFTVTDSTGNASNIATRNVSVTAVNDAPLLSAIESATLSYKAADPATAVTASLLVADADSDNLISTTVQITAGYQNGQDLLKFTNTAKITGSFNAATGTLTLTGSDTVSNYRTALRSVQYQNNSATPVTGMRTINLRGNDGAASNNLGNIVSRNISVTIGTPSVLSGVSATALAYTEKDPATSIASTIAIADTDSVNLSSATIQITGNYVTGQDRLAFTNSAGVTSSFDTTSGTLTLSGLKTLAAYQTMLRSVTYQNVSYNPNAATRTVNFTVVDDGGNSSNQAARTIQVTAVNDAPLLSAIEITTISYKALDPATIVTAALLVADADSDNLVSATVQISSGYQNGQDVLTFVNTAKISGVFNASTGTLTLSGVDTVSNYRTALRTVKFQNTSATPVTGLRTISFRGNDGSAANNFSNIVTRSVSVSIGSSPVLAGVSATPLAYTEKDPATVITSAITITDSDSVNLSGARIQITGNYSNGPDRLAFLNSAGVTASFDAASGSLILSGVRTLAAYQTMLQSVTFQNISFSPSTAMRTVTFTVTDDSSNSSNPVTRTINITAVNDRPLLSAIESTALNYHALDPAVAVTSSLLVADADNDNLISAKVWISSGYQSGQDILSFTNTAKITGSFDSSTGILTLTGVDSVSNYRSALRQVLFLNNNASPTAGTRTISFQANDGSALNNLSNIVSRNIIVS